MTTPPPRSALRRTLFTTLAALIMAAPMAGTAVATPSSPSAPGSHPPTSSKATTSKPKPKPAKITWSVQPSTVKGPDGRATFTWTDVKPRTVLHDYVGVSNFSAKPVTFRVYATDGFVDKNGGLNFLPAATAPTDIGTWVHLLHETVKVPAHSRVNEPFTVTVPANATPGDHTGAVLASILEAGQVKVDNRVGVPIYLRVNGPLRPVLSIESTSTSYHNTVNPFGGGGTNVSYTVHNTGNVRLTGTQTVSVTGPFGVTLATVHPAPLLQLLPGTFVRVSTHLPGVYPAGPLTVHVKIIPVPINGLRHTTGAPLAAVKHSVGMWTLPWPLLVLLVLLAGGGYGVWWWMRRRRQLHNAALAAAVEKGRLEAASELTKVPSNGSTPSTNGHDNGARAGVGKGKGIPVPETKPQAPIDPQSG
jgi:Bacterial protein of unknown function (DUF916)